MSYRTQYCKQGSLKPNRAGRRKLAQLQQQAKVQTTADSFDEALGQILRHDLAQVDAQINALLERRAKLQYELATLRGEPSYEVVRADAALQQARQDAARAVPALKELDVEVRRQVIAGVAC